MTVLSELLAAEETVAINGKEYRLAPLAQMDQLQIEQRILSKRRDPAQMVRELAPLMTAEERREFFERAYRDGMRAQYVTAGELDEFYQSVEGAALCFWLSLRVHHPEIDEDHAGRLLEQFGEQTLNEIVAAMQEQFADASREDIVEVAVRQERTVFGELLRKIAGLPSKNSSPPAKKPGHATGQSPGMDTSNS